METPLNKEVQIVEAKLQNLEELGIIARRSFLEAYPQNTDHKNMELYLNEVFTENEIKKQLLSANSIFFLLKVNDRICGYAKLRWDRSPNHFKNRKVVELERLYFLNEFKGRGHGSHLFQFCIDYSKEKQFEWMWLLVWQENLSGIKFYEKKRFEIFGRKIFHFGNESSEDILMKRQL
jgi:ribosomal protein S18 acetylase RimI-like enzyme